MQEVSRYFERLELGTRYTEVVDWIVDHCGKIYWECHKTLVVDATGVGGAVVDQLRAVRGLTTSGRLIGVQITGGTNPGYRNNNNGAVVSRIEVMSRLQSAVESQAFAIAGDCTESETVVRELCTLQREGKPEGGTGSEKQDDMAFALALAVWWAKPEKAQGPVE